MCGYIWALVNTAISLRSFESSKGSNTSCSSESIKLNLLDILIRFGISLLKIMWLLLAALNFEQIIIKRVRANVVFAIDHISKISFQQQIVNSSCMVMPISSNKLPCLFISILRACRYYFSNDALVYWNCVISYSYTD
jgi:hypothetical protein